MRTTESNSVNSVNLVHDGGFDRSIAGLFRDAVRISRNNPKTALFFAKAAIQQRRAAARRREWEKRGVHVPPVMIVSVTRRCNLRCAGCFVHAQGRPVGQEMSGQELRNVVAEARDLGVSMVALAGGEPLTRPEILDITGEHPEIIFLLITNGSLLSDDILARLQIQRNVIPLLSLEGFEDETDCRRGGGAYRAARQAMERMRQRRMFFGTSVMVTRHNFALVTGRAFAHDLVERGCRLFFYVDYVPIQPGTEHLIPNDAQRRAESLAMSLFRREFPGVFLAASASETAFGGCMAAGRGFIHVSAEGDLEPCPFSPFADTNLREVRLREALRSPFLRKIRESEEHLTESEGGCALWSKRDWVQSLVSGSEPVLRARSEGPGEPRSDGLAA
jgi:MoaA/NifB/PqqE/SkfB family radical SAM enzyme